jgi:hypothetical protein
VIRILRGCLVLALLLNSAGCYSYQKSSTATRSVPGESSSDEMERNLAAVPLRTMVKITLITGRSIEGHVTSNVLGRIQITSGQRQNRKTEIVKRADIASIQIHARSLNHGKMAILVMGGMIVVVGAVVGILVGSGLGASGG